MEETEKILLQNIQEFIKNGKKAEEDSSFNSAVTLFFKALAVLIDLMIYKKTGNIPSNHSQRFRILEEKFIEVYTILDKDFSIYQESYNLKLKKEHVEVIKDDIKKVSRIAEIKIDI